jgi:mono/diheme cytochrome c family protein
MFRTKLLSVALITCALAGSAVTLADDGVPAPGPMPADDGHANADGKPYKVTDGTKVDDYTMTGFRTWRQAACDRCHGANQEGMVGPSLIDSLKVLSKQDFFNTLYNGRPEKGMPQWNANPTVMGNINQLYAYLKGRSDGAITASKVSPAPAQ